MGSTFYQSEITHIWHKDSSFWASFIERDGTTDIQDLSRQNVCWDREVNEQLQTQFDKVVEHSLERMKKTFSQQTCYEVELKKYLVGRILTSHRFCQEHLQIVIRQEVSCDSSKSVQQNLTERYQKLSIQKLQTIIEKLR